MLATLIAPVVIVTVPLVAVIVPPNVAFSSTVNVSIFAVPSMNRFFHSLPDEPKLCVPSVFG